MASALTDAEFRQNWVKTQLSTIANAAKRQIDTASAVTKQTLSQFINRPEVGADVVRAAVDPSKLAAVNAALDALAASSEMATVNAAFDVLVSACYVKPASTSVPASPPPATPASN